VLQGVTAALLAMLLLLVGYLALRGYVEATLSTLTGVRTSFLSPLTVALVVVSAGALGALGSALSLRRYLQV
jgi:cell division transport system permease protein